VGRRAIVILGIGALACREPPASDRPDAPWPPGPSVGTHGATRLPTVWIEPVRSIRDLVAHCSEPGATFTWERDGAPAGIEGPLVAASGVWPGDVWKVLATAPDGRVATASIEVPEPPGGNVLVLLLDDIGVDQVGAYGVNADAPPTPTLDALAAEGLRFDRAYASPVCSPTRGVLLTGRQARRTGLGWIIDTGTRDYALPLASVIVPEALAGSRLGAWADSAVGKWHPAGPQNAGFTAHPNDSGFSWHAGSLGNPPYGAGRGYWDWDKSVNGEVSLSTTYMTTDTVDDALARIDAMPEPWFLYAAFNAAHTPLSAPPPELTTLEVTDASPDGELYDATVEALDAEMGRLLASMDPAVRARTTVMVIGDNGTSEYGVDPPFDPARAKHTVYEGGIHVPFVVTGPHVARPGSASDALVSVTDVFPTIMEIAGVPLGGPDDALVLEGDPPVPLDGRTLLPQLAAPEAAGRALLYVEGFSPNGDHPDYSLDQRILRGDRYKLMRLGDDPDRLFDLDDPEALEDGEDLLAAGTLDADAEAAWAELAAALDDIEQALVFEGF
jgi:arylsulfatase A-like enzyme